MQRSLLRVNAGYWPGGGGIVLLFSDMYIILFCLRMITTSRRKKTVNRINDETNILPFHLHLGVWISWQLARWPAYLWRGGGGIMHNRSPSYGSVETYVAPRLPGIDSSLNWENWGFVSVSVCCTASNFYVVIYHLNICTFHLWQVKNFILVRPT